MGKHNLTYVSNSQVKLACSTPRPLKNRLGQIELSCFDNYNLISLNVANLQIYFSGFNENKIGYLDWDLQTI